MGHPLRHDEPGLIHHVRGLASSHRESFRDDEDCSVFTRLVAIGCDRFGLRVLALCLMSTHYHAAVLSNDGRLSEAMQWILANYVRWWNQKYDSSGSLFNGRFKSTKVESSDQLVNTIRYIHANALDLPGVTRAEEHRWSTCAMFTGSRPSPPWLLRSAVAYVLRHDRRLANARTKTHRSRREATDPARVPLRLVRLALARYREDGFAVRPHPAPPARGPCATCGGSFG